MSIISVDEQSKMIAITCRKIMGVHKKHNFFVSIHIGSRWMKPTQPDKSIFLTPTLLMAARRRRPQCRLVYTTKLNSVCVCFSSSDTTGGTSIKLGTNNHYFRVSVIRVFVTSSWRQKQRQLLKSHLWTEKTVFGLNKS